MSATLDKIKEEVKTLGTDELHQVRELVDSLLTHPEKQMSEDEFESALAAKGIIAPVAQDDAAANDFRKYQPIQVGGQPLSEMIIEERR